LGSLDSKETRRLFAAQSNAQYAPPGYLLFGREGTLMAQPFDTGKLALNGEPFPGLGRDRTGYTECMGLLFRLQEWRRALVSKGKQRNELA
jgi:hypothetical protein